jgi:glycosyltransferase 2 family protein
LAFLVAGNLGDLNQFLRLLLEAQASWLLLALVLQVFTYVLTGAVWTLVAASSGQVFTLKQTSVLAVEQLAIDQIVPVGGVAGNTIIGRSMTDMGMPSKLAAETVLVSILSFHIAYSIVTAWAVALLWSYANLTPIIVAVVSGYFLISIIVTVTTLLVTFNKVHNIPKFFRRWRVVNSALEIVKQVSPDKVLSATTLTRTSILRIGVFILDAGTLWVVMIALGVPIHLLAAFTALVIGSIAGSITLLPGGIGGFEVGAVATLLLFGVSTEAALAGTILLRGLTLWLPLIPGMYLVKNRIYLSDDMDVERKFSL